MKTKNLLIIAGFFLTASFNLLSCKKSTPPPVNGGGGNNGGPADSVKVSYAGGILGNTSTRTSFTFVAGKTYNITQSNAIFVNADVVVQAGAKILFGGTPLAITIGSANLGHDHKLSIHLDQFRNHSFSVAKPRTLSSTLSVLGDSFPNPDTGSASHVYSIYLTSGSTLNCQGTQSSHVTFTSQNPNAVWPNGYWGGINCDSTTKSVQLEWTDISHTGGSDSIAQNQYAFYVGGTKTSTTTVIIENSSIEYGVDDCTRLEGNIKIAIRGNIFKRQGSNDGDGINIKSGVTGDVCYNYCWAGANNSIKLNADISDLTLNTNVNVYNNTIIQGGWRKVGEASSGILIDQNAKGTCFNNLIINCKNGFTVTALSDTLYFTGTATDYATQQANINKAINNNFIYALVDSAAAHSYGFLQWGTKRSNDISSLTLAGQTDPMISKLDLTSLVGYTDQLNSYPDNNDPHLQSGSPAIGKGNANATYNNQLNYGSQWAPGEDIGAFQVTNTQKGNLRGDN